MQCPKLDANPECDADHMLCEVVLRDETSVRISNVIEDVAPLPNVRGVVCKLNAVPRRYRTALYHVVAESMQQTFGFPPIAMNFHSVLWSFHNVTYFNCKECDVQICG